MWVKVILPLRVDGSYLYFVPKNLEHEVSIGKRVIVSFGKRRKYTALISEIITTPPQVSYVVKSIESVVDMKPVITGWQLSFWKWIAEYYMCTLGEIINAAFPSNLRLESESVFTLNPEWNKNLPLTPNEKKLVYYLEQHKKIREGKISSLLGKSKIRSLLQIMLEKKILLREEYMKDNILPHQTICIRLTAHYEDENQLSLVLQQLERKSPNQYHVLLKIIESLNEGHYPEKKIVQKSFSSTALKALEKKGIIEFFKTENKSPASQCKGFSFPSVQLTDDQQRAIEQIHKSFSSGKNVLLYGPTGSGKTIIYIHLIQEALKQRKQVLFLLPEISLTEFMVKRIQNWLGNDVPVWMYHSRTTNRERTKIWKEMLEGRVGVVVGARSAIFLPFDSLGLIVVDEEHDTSYKQTEAPRYHARDTALMLGKITHVPVILGSATPSLDAYHLAKTGKITLVHLRQRYGDAIPPVIHIVNMRPHIARKEMRGSLTPLLFQQIKQTLQREKQIILFQNRRGYSTWVECDSCGWSPTCQHCDANLTYHRDEHALICHHCGYAQNIPGFCPQCHSPKILMRGVGTQRIEEELFTFFPHARIARLDHDIVRQTGQLQALFDQFERREIDILVGTQMVTKGLDFSHVDLVGILNADLLYPYPDFRSYEHALQLMLQVAGRAGRRDHQGTVIIQTQTSRSPLIKYITQFTYDDFMFDEILFRQKFRYPPFVRLIKLLFLHNEKEIANKASNDFAQFFKNKFSYSLLGPDLAPLSKIQDQYIFQLLIKLPKDNNLLRTKQTINDLIAHIHDKYPSNLKIIVDVDPI
ncbi:MAG: primosomal protein N' [Bacteroidales bacterium]|nr:primosomal protein N' [Bacteroidales bacterium]